MPTGWLIYNPAAGRFPARPLVERAARVLRENGWQVEVHQTQDSLDLPELARRAVAAGCQAVFVAGGDGSVGQVAGALAGTETALAVLPAGTANVWARELGLRHLDWTHWFALEEAARRLARGHVRLVDLGVCNGRTFLLWAGVGLDGKVVNAIEPRERWEKAFSVVHYAVEALWASLDWQGIDLRVRSGERVWEDRFLVAVASNIRAYAGGLVELAPEARIDDGLLDFWLISGQSVRDAVVSFTYILLGRHREVPGVVHFQASEAEFEAEASLPMQLDGEPAQAAPPVRFGVRPRVLRVLVPEGGWPRLWSEEAAEEAP